MKKETPVVLHQGTYKRTATTAEAVFMITGMTIGAGVLGLPYAIEQAGLLFGLGAIVLVGILVLVLNLMIARVAVQTRRSLQLPGLVGVYLGKPAQVVLSILIVASSLGTLLAYIVGEGQALTALSGRGTPFVWSIVFWLVGAALVWGGLQRVKTAEKILSSVVMVLVVTLSIALLPELSSLNLTVFEPGRLLFPWGVILFALHGSPAIAEAHALLPGQTKRFRRAVIVGTLLPLLIYLFFTLAVVGTFGALTPEIATTGLGVLLGRPAAIAGNIFAVLAMSTGFMGLATALKQSLVWDSGIPKRWAKMFVLGVPIILFLVGIRGFIGILQVVGGVFISLEILLMTFVYIVARRRQGRIHK